MQLRGSGKEREVLATLNVERETGRIYRSDALRQQYSSEQAPQGNPQLGSRYLIADVEAEQLMASAGLGQNGPPSGGELVVPVRGDLEETGKQGSYRVDPASVRPGEPMTPGTRQIEDRITTRAKELDSQGQAMSRAELDEIVQGVQNDGGTVGMKPQRAHPEAQQSQLGPNSQAGLASHRSGVPFNGVVLRPESPAHAQQQQAQQPSGRIEQPPGEPRKAPKRELPIPGMITSNDVPRSSAHRPEITEGDGVVSATRKGFVSGFQGERQRQKANPATERSEARTERFPELRGTSEQQEGPTAGGDGPAR